MRRIIGIVLAIGFLIAVDGILALCFLKEKKKNVRINAVLIGDLVNFIDANKYDMSTLLLFYTTGKTI